MDQFIGDPEYWRKGSGPNIPEWYFIFLKREKYYKRRYRTDSKIKVDWWKNALNFVFEEDGKIKGLLIALKKHNNAIHIVKEGITYFIDDIVVDSKYRRKKALYEYLVNKAKSDNVDSIELNVWAFNKLALNFYESLGITVKNMKLENILSNNNVDI